MRHDFSLFIKDFSGALTRISNHLHENPVSCCQEAAYYLGKELWLNSKCTLKQLKGEDKRYIVAREDDDSKDDKDLKVLAVQSVKITPKLRQEWQDELDDAEKQREHNLFSVLNGTLIHFEHNFLVMSESFEEIEKACERMKIVCKNSSDMIHQINKALKKYRESQP